MADITLWREQTEEERTEKVNPQTSSSTDLLPVEQALFMLFRDTVNYFQLSTVLRVAGGWVRDKLLMRQNHDIDIATSDVLGKEFAEKVQEFMSLNNLPQSSIAVIKSNPAQSKHLETARMTLFGVEIDFVNLRTETYSEDSRIPSISFGTPEEDACRRDLTINSLFYNIQTMQVEDFTGNGLNDLANKIARTPLEPQTTLFDDPLRMLRVVRFSARYNLTLDQPLSAALSLPSLHSALASKISRERIGAELQGILSSSNPLHGLSLLREHQLFDAIFPLPDDLIWSCEWMDESMRLTRLIWTPEATLAQLFAAILFPVSHLNIITPKAKTIPISVHLLHQYALGHNLSDEVTLLLESAHALSPPITNTPATILNLASVIENGKEQWTECVHFASIAKSSPSLASQQIEQEITTIIHDLNLPLLLNFQPLCSGNDLSSHLRQKKMSPVHTHALVKFLHDWTIFNVIVVTPTPSRDDATNAFWKALEENIDRLIEESQQIEEEKARKKKEEQIKQKMDSRMKRKKE
ncbi:putative Poly A polymerase [Blattamonas nauphoetae]|uniref:Poly A polymerase n=1 Tax=Blattamonas nauphoetae TaxID=2049346 RepID=A0ABQ9YFX5_9EUKA|nr:putative Poly A polymerase [Blattamonas nauphoetae]